MLPLRPALLVPLVVLVVLVGITEAEAQPYERAQIDSSAPLCRNTRTIQYALATSATRPTPAERAAVVAAFNTWNQAVSSCSDLVFEQAADVPGGTPVPLDGKTLVSFRQTKCADVVPPTDRCHTNDSCVEKYDCWDHRPEDFMSVPLVFKFSTGVIAGANIEVNATDGMLTTVEGPACPYGVVQPGCVARDVQRIVTPGIGRALGFNMISRPDSTMYNILEWGDLKKRAIDPGTLQGICDLYPRGQPTPGCPPPEEDIPHEEPEAPSKKGCSATASAPLVGALVLLLGLRRGKSRRSLRTTPAARRSGLETQEGHTEVT